MKYLVKSGKSSLNVPGKEHDKFEIMTCPETKSAQVTTSGARVVGLGPRFQSAASAPPLSLAMSTDTGAKPSAFSTTEMVLAAWLVM